ncbi:hypothetical protein DA075_06615 [Methylobacterium currus]|uniref:Uncharacterized protein n=1 Tax=Methylobacterium currus TaxID=2051553 RepID=A0A2R4WGG8_9HYPH|nr:hypothetical protein [Methylobacterium currus]AWB20636.1 hypothetical protein DA075_06615 [Methylobacterium currus]
MSAFTTTVSIPLDKVVSQIITAVEGGITYWASTFHHVSSEHEPKERPWYADQTLYEGAFDIKVLIHEEHKAGEGIEYHLTREKLQSGLDFLAKNRPARLKEVLDESGDADTADEFMQACLFGELIYG